LAQAIGSAVDLGLDALHHLTLALLVHDIGLLALPCRLTAHSGYLDFQSYAVVQAIRESEPNDLSRTDFSETRR
jgi:HD-GYP domain-containing protein (c-di-GMP phosphodiesterase class II)